MPRYTPPFTDEELAIIEMWKYQERFWAKVLRQPGDACWLWQGARSRNGYGGVRVGYKMAPTHRVSWAIMHGQIPVNLWVLHACDRFYAPGDTSYRACVRTDHLFLGTARDNTQDAVVKGRAVMGERNPRSKFTEDQVRDIRDNHTSATGTAYSTSALARRFAVNRSTIQRIARGINWRHIR